MDLAARRSARQHSKLVMRLGVCLVTVSLLLGLALPPKAEAFVLTTTSVVALVGGFLAACGLPFLVKGMNESGLTESVGRLLQEYFSEENIQGSLLDWAGSAPLTMLNGKIIIPGLLTQKLTAFAQWVAAKYGAMPGENVVYQNSVSYLADGTQIKFATFIREGNTYTFTVYPDTTSFSFNTWYELSNGKSFSYSRSDNEITLKLIEDGVLSTYIPHSFSGLSSDNFYISVDGNGISSLKIAVFQTISGYIPASSYFPDSFFISVDESLSVDVAETVQQILERLTALEEGQSVALDVGATHAMTIEEILQSILDKIIAGDLTASAEAVDSTEVPEEPPDDIPYLPSGLDKLGAALTTRFPFSIPWDVYKGIQLLAAPPKAPYFEVDLLAPIAHRVGGWNGSTAIVLDMSEYEIIGQVSRWTSTIGFCLMLASGTKRLMWTA